MASKNSQPAEAIAEEKLPVEMHFSNANTPDWLVAAMKAKFKYPQGFMMTATQFEEAVKATNGEVIR